MGFFDKFKKKDDDKKKPVEPMEKAEKVEKPAEKKEKPETKLAPSKVSVDKQDKKKEVAKSTTKTEDLKGKTKQAYQVLVKPLVTEKASDLGVLNKYVFAINPRMNKIEVKKAIRTIYNVDPIKVNIANFSGKNVRYGRVKGKTKAWKKAIVTLKQGDKIEVYEGV